MLAGALISPGSPVSVIDCAPAPHGAISIAAAAQARETAPPGPPARVIPDTTVHAPDTRWRTSL